MDISNKKKVLALNSHGKRKCLHIDGSWPLSKTEQAELWTVAISQVSPPHSRCSSGFVPLPDSVKLY